MIGSLAFKRSQRVAEFPAFEDIGKQSFFSGSAKKTAHVAHALYEDDVHKTMHACYSGSRVALRLQREIYQIYRNNRVCLNEEFKRSIRYNTLN